MFYYQIQELYNKTTIAVTFHHCFQHAFIACYSLKYGLTDLLVDIVTLRSDCEDAQTDLDVQFHVRIRPIFAWRLTIIQNCNVRIMTSLSAVNITFKLRPRVNTRKYCTSCDRVLINQNAFNNRFNNNKQYYNTVVIEWRSKCWYTFATF